jgi:hypothetical protein
MFKTCHLYILILPVALFRCNHPVNKTSLKSKGNKPVDIDIAANKQTDIKKSTNTEPWPEPLYIIKRDGVDGMEEPDSNTMNHGLAVNDFFRFGARIKLISVKNGWMEIQKEECDHCYSLFVPQSCKCIGNESAVPLSSSDLDSLYRGERQHYDGDENDVDTSRLTEFKLERVSEAEFYRQKKLAVNLFTADTGRFKKKDSVLVIKAVKKTVKLKDSVNGEHEEAYDYLGEYKSINKLVIAGTYNESADYFFIDGITGKDLGSGFVGFPYLSPDKKYAVCVNTNDGDERADINFYAIKKDSVVYIAGNHFQYWMPITNGPGMFWGRDNCFYFPLVPYGAWNKPDKKALAGYSPNRNYRYAKIIFKRFKR